MANRLNSFGAQVLELAGRHAEQAEIYAVESTETPVAFEANRLKQLKTRRSRGVALRVVKNGRLGLASTTLLENPADLVNDAIATTEFGAEASFELPARMVEQRLALFDPEAAELPIEKMVEMGQRMIDRARAENDTLLCEASLDKQVVNVWLANSRGFSGSYGQTSLSASFGANLIRGTDMLDVWESHASGRLDLEPEKLVDVVLHKVQLAERLAAVPTAQLPVIFSPKGMAQTLLNSLATGFNGKMVLQGASPVGDKLGQKAFSDQLTLFDDGLIDYGLASAPFDGDGIPTRRNTLIHNGVVSSFLYDLHTASLAGKETTGNAGRSLASLPTPTSHTLWIEPGHATLEDMLADIKEGVLIDQVMGAWAGNVLAGEFSGNVHLGYRIENGQIVGRVKDTMVAGNVFHALGDIAALGSELHWIHGSLRLPYIYLPALGVASKAS